MDTSKKYKNERKEVARFMRRLYSHGLTTTSGGNISLKVSDNIIALTPSATDKGNMKWKEVGLLTLKGENLTPDLKPSIEAEMHLSIYRKKDVKAIVHAHPTFTTTFTAMKNKINIKLTAEAYAILEEPFFVPYAIMGSRKLADQVSDNVDKSNILLLENHGVLTTGSTLLQAFDKIEVLENAARMTLIVDFAGKKKSLSKEKIKEIEKLFK
jgi:L-fuculose-phosphate aldolase